MIRRFLISLLFISLVSSAVEWGDRTEGELHWGEHLRLGEYALEVADFTPEDSTPRMVMRNLYQGKELIASRALEAGDNFSIDDRVLVTAEKIEMRDYLLDECAEACASVGLQTRAVPELRLYLVTEKDSYEPGEYIDFRLSVENTGTVEAEFIKVDLVSEPPLVFARYARSSLVPGEVWDEDLSTEKVDPIEFRQKAPYPPGPEEFRVKARARYLDPEGDPGEAWGETIFDVFGLIKLHKYLEETQNFGEDFYVCLSLRNSGNKTLNVEVTDSAGRDFETDSSLEWDLEIPSGSSEVMSYRLGATRPGEEQTLPPAEAVYSMEGVSYKVFSESPVVDVIGPLVEIKRRASSARVRVGEDVVVTVEAKNVENRRTKVSLEEPVPEWAKLRAGETWGSWVLMPEETATLEYTISCRRAGRFEVPGTIICYRNGEGAACSADSSPLRIIAEEANEVCETPDAGDLPCEAILSGAGDPDEEDRDTSLLIWALLVVILLLFLIFDRYS